MLTDARKGKNSDWILAFDTSAAHCAAALLCGDRVILRDEQMANGQAERLIPLLEEMLAGAGIRWPDVCAIGVGTGPGNFTGVRISVAAARGLALGLGIPAVGVTALDAMAFGAALPVTVKIDARRGDAYVQSFTDQGPGLARLTGAAAAQTEAVGDVIGLGGADAPYALAEAIARITAKRWKNPQPRPAPFYLRGAHAAPPSDPPPVILP